MASIERGLLLLLGVAEGDSIADAEYLASKVAGMRIFSDGQGKMNLSVQDVGGGVLVISQFTLLGDIRKGKRPSFTGAAPPEAAKELYEQFCQILKAHGVSVSQGIFQADMQVSLVNDGPVTILLDSRKIL